MAATAANTGYQATFGIDDGAGGYDTVAEVYSISPPNRSREAPEASHLNSPDGYKEFIAGGLIDPGEATIELNFVPAATDDIVAALEAGAQDYQITFPGGAVTLTFTAICTSHEIGALTENDKMTLTATFKVTGKPTLA